MLLFKEKFLKKIRSGEKSQTIRLWDRRRMRAGQRSYIPGIGYVLITSVKPIELDDLNDNIARLDGFHSADELRAELHALYGKDMLAKRKAYIIRFSVLPQSEQEKIAEERKNRAERKAILSGSYQCFDF